MYRLSFCFVIHWLFLYFYLPLNKSHFVNCVLNRDDDDDDDDDDNVEVVEMLRTQIVLEKFILKYF